MLRVMSGANTSRTRLPSIKKRWSPMLSADVRCRQPPAGIGDELDVGAGLGPHCAQPARRMEVLRAASEHDRARAVGEDERYEPAVAARMLAVVRVHLGGEVSRRAVARDHERGRRRFGDEIRRRGPQRGRQSGTPEVVVDEVGVAPQAEFSLR